MWQILFNHRLTRSKDSSRDLQPICVISFYFRLYSVLHACDARFDVTENFENFLDFGGNSTKALLAAAFVDGTHGRCCPCPFLSLSGSSHLSRSGTAPEKQC